MIEDSQPFLLHLGFDDWQSIEDRASVPLGLGMHGVQIDRGELEPWKKLNFTRFNRAEGRWEGVDHTILLRHAPGDG